MKKKLGGAISNMETITHIGLLIFFGFSFYYILYQPKLIETNNATGLIEFFHAVKDARDKSISGKKD